MEICRRGLAEAFMQRTYWSMDDIVLSHTGLNQAVDYGASVRQPPKPLHYSKFERAATPNPTHGYLTLHFVPHGSSEEEAVLHATGIIHRGYHPLCLLLRVQNNVLYNIFLNYYLRDPNQDKRSELGIGFHGTSVQFLERILLNNLDPSISFEGNHGRSFYLSENPAFCLDGAYASEIKTPVYRDMRNGLLLFRRDTYQIVILFVCNYGKRFSSEYFTFGKGETFPSGFGTCYDAYEGENILSMRHHERICPAYLLLFRTKDEVPPNPRFLERQYREQLSHPTQEDWDPDLVDYKTLGLRVLEYATHIRMAHE